MFIAPSCSLLHSPVDLDSETKLDAELKNWLAFARQKIKEINVIAKAVNNGHDSVKAELAANKEAMQSRATSKRIHNAFLKSLQLWLTANQLILNVRKSRLTN